MSQSEELAADEALRLLGEVHFGRVVFTSQAMPSIRPVRHVLAGGQVVIAAGPDFALGPAAAGGETIVAYEADQLDVTGSSGWSVVVVGRARPVATGAELDRYRRLLAAGRGDEPLVVISTDVVTGFRVVPERREPVPAGS